MNATTPQFALSIRQPWAWFILNLGKDVENRTWRTLFRGPVWIHAGKGMTRYEYEEACEFASAILDRPKIPAFKDLERGGIVGRADITGCVTASRSPWFGFGLCVHYGFTLANPEPCEFLPCKGALGFFKVQNGGAK